MAEGSRSLGACHWIVIPCHLALAPVYIAPCGSCLPWSERPSLCILLPQYSVPLWRQNQESKRSQGHGWKSLKPRAKTHHSSKLFCQAFVTVARKVISATELQETFVKCVLLMEMQAEAVCILLPIITSDLTWKILLTAHGSRHPNRWGENQGAEQQQGRHFWKKHEVTSSKTWKPGRNTLGAKYRRSQQHRPIIQESLFLGGGLVLLHNKEKVKEIYRVGHLVKIGQTKLQAPVNPIPLFPVSMGKSHTVSCDKSFRASSIMTSLWGHSGVALPDAPDFTSPSALQPKPQTSLQMSAVLFIWTLGPLLNYAHTNYPIFIPNIPTLNWLKLWSFEFQGIFLSCAPQIVLEKCEIVLLREARW